MLVEGPMFSDDTDASLRPESAEPKGAFTIEDHMISLFEERQAAVVRVHASIKEAGSTDSRMAIVTGFFVSPQGHVVTTIPGAQGRVWVDHSGRPFMAECLCSDAASGIAILKVLEPPEALPFIALSANAVPCKQGAFCLAISREMGLAAAPSLGIIKNNKEVSRVLPTEYLRTDLSCPVGAAGGPVFSLRTHELLGVQVGIVAQSASSLVLPTEALRKIYDDVMNSKKVQYAWMGVSARLDHDLEKGSSALVVDAVDPSSPAEEFDIREGDRLIQIGNRPITSIGDLNAALFFACVGQYVPVITQRGDKKISTDIRLRQRPERLPAPRNPRSTQEPAEESPSLFHIPALSYTSER